MKLLVSLLTALIAACGIADACTSMVVGCRGSATGRPLLWKHRDTGADNNFLARVEPTDSTLGYVGLFNAGDSLLREAWMGMNDSGFAIMNTASYNLMPDTAKFLDQEAVVMSAALGRCTTVADFERMLSEWPRPMGVQANFGVIDAEGGAAYFETDDHGFKRFDCADSPDDALIRTNYSISGTHGLGSGRVRYNTATELTAEARQSHNITPALLTDTLSRSFYHSALGRDCVGDSVVANQDFIPRDISTASIVVEGINPAHSGESMQMYARLGYPPTAELRMATLSYIPEDFLPNAEWRSEACDRSMRLWNEITPDGIDHPRRYIIMPRLRARMK